MINTNARLEDVDFVAFDLETTGLSPIGGAIVEFGAVRFRLDGTRSAVFNQLVNPGMPIPHRATCIHGITDEMVRDQPAVEGVLLEFIAFLDESNALLMAHNATFDLGFIHQAIARCDVAVPQSTVVDTLDLARRFLPRSGSYRLEDLAIRLGIAPCEEHRALADAELAADLFRAIVRRTRSLKTLDDLLAQAQRFSLRPDQESAVQIPKQYDGLVAAIHQQRHVLLMYDGGTRGVAERRVTPKRIVQSGGRVYLCAYCHRDEIEKSYRLDRIRRYKVE